MPMSTLILFNKPFSVLSQFTDDNDRTTLKKYIDIPDVYPAGRLDYDSEGLLLLTDDGALQHKLAHPKHKLAKTYLVQVEGLIDQNAIDQLKAGILLKDGMSKPAQAQTIQPPNIPPRTPPIRSRKNSPTSWLELSISEGKNRQVRRMTAAVGFPTLRLYRYKIGNWSVENLKPGEYTTLTLHLPKTAETSKQNPHRNRSKNAYQRNTDRSPKIKH